MSALNLSPGLGMLDGHILIAFGREAWQSLQTLKTLSIKLQFACF